MALLICGASGAVRDGALSGEGLRLGAALLPAGQDPCRIPVPVPVPVPSPLPSLPTAVGSPEAGPSVGMFWTQLCAEPPPLGPRVLRFCARL